jgi:carbonic anhydrase/acetyltransferase-like protein (isoleucine patch superfamily)
MSATPEPLFITIKGHTPQLDAQAWVVPNATVLGQVILAEGVVPPRSLVAGVPGKVRRELSDEGWPVMG